MVKEIKNRFAIHHLNQWIRNNKHQRRITTFAEVKSIGIIYDATEPDTDTEIKRLTKKLGAMGKEIYTLGFVNKKALPANIMPQTKEDYFCKGDLHWYELPIKDRISRFANEQFDYLLNIYSTDSMPMMGVSALSKAHCRLGTFHLKFTGCYDFMLSETQPMSPAELLDAFILYLYKLKND
jgi:hypothetical protein